MTSQFLPDNVRDNDPRAPWNFTYHCATCWGCDDRCNPADHDTCKDHANVD